MVYITILSRIAETKSSTAQASSSVTPAEARSVIERDLQKTNEISFNPIETVARIQDARDLVKSAINRLKRKRSPYFQGALNELEWMQEIHKEMGDHGGVEYLYGTQFWWIKPDRKSTRLNSSHRSLSRMPSSA